MPVSKDGRWAKAEPSTSGGSQKLPTFQFPDADLTDLVRQGQRPSLAPWSFDLGTRKTQQERHSYETGTQIMAGACKPFVQITEQKSPDAEITARFRQAFHLYALQCRVPGCLPRATPHSVVVGCLHVPHGLVTDSDLGVLCVARSVPSPFRQIFPIRMHVFELSARQHQWVGR